MCTITDFFCEGVTWVNSVGNIYDIGRFVLVAFTNVIIAEIEVLGAF